MKKILPFFLKKNRTVKIKLAISSKSYFWTFGLEFKCFHSIISNISVRNQNVSKLSKLKLCTFFHTWSHLESLVNIIHNLKSTLEEIDVNKTNVSRTKILDLKSIPTLIVLNHGFGDMNSEFSGFIRRKVDVAC